MASTSETPRSVELGLLLRDFRKRAGLSQEALAAQLGRGHSHISRWENGKLPIDEPDIGAVLAVLHVTGEERAKTLDLHRVAADPNWLALGVGRELAVVREYENNADRITNVQPSLVPGPLQTPEYAMTVFVGAGATQEQARDWVDFRMSRREAILNGDTEYITVIGEYALRYPACNRSTAIDQMQFLAKLAARDHVTVQILPLTLQYTPARAGSFVLIESGKSKPVVHLEQFRSRSTLTDAKDVRDYMTAAKDLRRDALSPAATTGLIADITSEMERTT